MKSYNTLDEIRDELIPLGFHEYEPSKLDNDGICTCFQKRYDDEIGKKYFIDIRVWDWTWTDRIPERYHPEIYCQLYQKYTHDAVNLEFIDWDLRQVENFINAMFASDLLEHYETWEES